jgi:hypothetical protein
MSIQKVFQTSGANRLVEPFGKFTRQGIPLSDAQNAVIYYYFVDELEEVMGDPWSRAMHDFLRRSGVFFAHAVHTTKYVVAFLSWFTDKRI